MLKTFKYEKKIDNGFSQSSASCPRHHNLLLLLLTIQMIHFSPCFFTVQTQSFIYNEMYTFCLISREKLEPAPGFEPLISRLAFYRVSYPVSIDGTDLNISHNAQIMSISTYQFELTSQALMTRYHVM